MTSAHRLIAFHFAIGFGMLLLLHDEVMTTLGTASLVNWAVIAIAGLAAIGILYLSERQRFPEPVYSAWSALPEREITILGLFGVVMLGAVGLGLLYSSTIPWFYDVGVGAYVSLIGYRIVYGLVFPVPEAALGRI
ncbi:hypothetical protein [Haloarcula sebkhae]|uniref:Uncharacterized protein n=2 Tax=Haloarcula sebkhae TaxID=932660 RepID=A0ACC6VJ54_9EURY|nr:hypothetical protein [Haloarcula sebkhae]GGK75351.1 hypothetical protein GCM10009067_29560 [Haloarcula sebkhae]